MTIEIKVKCDAYGCCNSSEIQDWTCIESRIERAGYFTLDPLDGDHYCGTCWQLIIGECK